ncbi:MAG: BamA/TamA family outer membrane protein, partial [Gammaproteobacteria bacterium]|nr:BamA/TamA family outer membrane protein [Gammaproteobacteria bacterium]
VAPAGWAGSYAAARRRGAAPPPSGGRGGGVVGAAGGGGARLQAGTFHGLSGAHAGSGRRIAHPEMRFYAGGSNSVRGYAQNELGARVVSVPVDRLLLPQDTASAPVCAPEEVVALTCSAAFLAETAFLARPTGGARLVEGSLELRFPLWGSVLGGAAFLDFGRVWDPAGAAAPPAFEYTPGGGLRYDTPIGPVRVDVGYRGTPVRDVPVVTSQIRPFDPARGDAAGDRIGADAAGELGLDWVEADDLALLEPTIRFRGGSRVAWWRGLQLHFSIGQAF